MFYLRKLCHICWLLFIIIKLYHKIKILVRKKETSIQLAILNAYEKKNDAKYLNKDFLGTLKFYLGEKINFLFFFRMKKTILNKRGIKLKEKGINYSYK